MQRDDTLSWDRYTVLEEDETPVFTAWDAVPDPALTVEPPVMVEVVDLTIVCYEHWVSYPEGMSCPDCDAERAALRAALAAQS